MNDIQEFADILVIGLRDIVVIDAIQYHQDQGADEHDAVVVHLIQALDNMYGVGSYFRYINTGVLPSDQ